MSAIKDQAAPETRRIQRRTVPDADRSAFFPKRAGALCFGFEHMIYGVAAAQSDYLGGYWEFYELDNGGWYVAPRLGHSLEFACPNGYSGTLSDDAAGVAVSLIAINYLLWTVYQTRPTLGDELRDAFYALRDYASQHDEAAAIFGVID